MYQGPGVRDPVIDGMFVLFRKPPRWGGSQEKNECR